MAVGVGNNPSTLQGGELMDQETILIVLTALGAIGEALSLVPWINANGICQAVVAVIRAVARR